MRRALACLLATLPLAALAQAPVPETPEDLRGPVIEHAPVAKAQAGQPLKLEARIADDSGVFEPPTLYLRDEGGRDYIPLRLDPVPNAAGLYAVEVPAVLVTANLEYYLEAWDKLGNGPSRNGNPEHPHVVKLERPKPRVVEKKEEKKPGAPPAVSHIPVQKATKGRSIPLEALFASQTGLSRPTVEFRRQGAPAFTALPMVDAGGNKYLAEIPAAFVTGDLEYYVEAFDANGNGPGRSGDPTLPYRITVEDEVAAPPPTPMVGAQVQPQYYAPPPPRPPRVHGFKPFAGEAASWILMTGGVAAAVFAGGDALGGSLAHDLYTHKLSYEHIADTAMLEHANAFASHATILAGVSAGCFLVGGVMLGIIETARDKEDARQADADAAEDAAAAVKAIQQQQGRPR